MDSMFSGASSLTTLDLSNFDTSKVTGMNNMFSGAGSLTTLDLTSFDTSKVTNMVSMFSGVSSLTTLELPNFDTSNVSNMNNMFNGMSSMTVLDISNFDTSGILGGTTYMFSGMPELRKIALSSKFKFISSSLSGFPLAPSDKPYTGKWMNIGDGRINSQSRKYVYSSEELQTQYNGMDMADTYVWESDSSVITVHDSNVYVGDEWKAEDNFDSALDKDGNKVEFKDLTVDDSKVDLNKAGTYEVTYSYDGLISVAKVTVKAKQTAINVHDSNIYVGDEWGAEDNFDSALDKDGNKVDFKDVKVSGNVDTMKAGNYEVTYSYDGLRSTAKVSVLEVEVEQNLAHIAVHDSELKVGDDWSPQDNFDKAISYDGKEVNFSDVAVSGAVDTKKPGTYEVIYSIPEDYWGRDIVEGRHTATAKIVVSEEKDNDDRDSNSKGENSDSDKNNSSSTDNTSGKNDFQNNKGLPKTGEHTSALIFMMGIALLVLGSIFSILRVKKKKK